jgi:cytochrome c oxidase cbb3-type subunit I/II
MITLNVPYPKNYDKYAKNDVLTQAREVTVDLATAGITTSADKKIIALIAYLQRLGTDIKGINNNLK